MSSPPLCSIVRFRVISLQSSPIIFVANGSRVRVTIRLIFGVNCLHVMQCATSHEFMRSEVRTSVAATPPPIHPQSPQLCSWRVESATLRLHCYRRDQSKSYSSTLFSSSLHTFALHWGTLSIVVQYGVFSSADGDNSSAWISCSIGLCVVHVGLYAYSSFILMMRKRSSIYINTRIFWIDQIHKCIYIHIYMYIHVYIYNYTCIYMHVCTVYIVYIIIYTYVWIYVYT